MTRQETVLAAEEASIQSNHLQVVGFTWSKEPGTEWLSFDVVDVQGDYPQNFRPIMLIQRGRHICFDGG
jgi:hypothetical protein